MMNDDQIDQKNIWYTLFNRAMIHARKITLVISEVGEAVAFSQLVNEASSALRINKKMKIKMSAILLLGIINGAQC